MKLLCIMAVGYNDVVGKVLILAKHQYLKSFGMFVRGSVSDTFKFLARESLMSFEPGSKHCVRHGAHLAFIRVDVK